MNDPNSTDSADEAMLESLEAEYMALAKKGDRSAFDFALEFSDKVNISAQSIMMALMVSAVFVNTNDEVALWARCARRAFLDVLENEAATEWAITELKRRRAQNLEMQQGWKEDLTKDAQSAGIQSYS